MKKILEFSIIFIILIGGLIGALVLSCCFPSTKIYENVKESSELLLTEGNRKIVFVPYRNEKIQFDNFSDSLMINTAYSIDSSTPLYSAFVARKNYIPNVTTEIYEDTAGELKSSSKYKYHNEVGELNDLVNGEKAESFEYARYWHGYLIVLRPLLLLLNISQIRIMLTIILFVLAIILLCLIYKKLDIVVALIYLLSLVGVEYFYMQYSIHGIFVFLIFMISTIYILIRYDKIKDITKVFLIIGILTSFFDLMTFPLLSLGVPIITYLLLEEKSNKEKTFKERNKTLIQNILAWGMGYGLMWFSKWLLSDIIFNKNLILTALQQVLYRTNGMNKNYSILEAVSINFKYEIKIIIITLLLNVLANIMKIIKLISKKESSNININISLKKFMGNITPYIITLLLPIVLYIVITNHSYNHYFFTYRNLLIFNISLNLIVKKCFDIYMENMHEKNKIK